MLATGDRPVLSTRQYKLSRSLDVIAIQRWASARFRKSPEKLDVKSRSTEANFKLSPIQVKITSHRIKFLIFFASIVPIHQCWSRIRIKTE